MKKTSYLLFLLLSLLLQSALIGQTPAKAESGAFIRNSVTVIPLAGSSVNRYHQLLLDNLSFSEMEGRFDYNEITRQEYSKIQSNYLSSQFDLTQPDAKATQDIIISFLRNNKVIENVIKSTGNYDSLVARHLRQQKRLVTTAAEQKNIKAPTVPEMMQLMNNSFIGIAVLNGVEVKSATEATSTGNFYWFRLNVTDTAKWDGQTNLPVANTVEVVYVKSKVASVGFSPILKTGEVKPDEESVKLFGQGIFKLAISLDEFKLRGTIQDATEGYRFDLGNREGVYLDQGYKVYELAMSAEGKSESQYMGFGRVKEVGNNKEKMDALSSMYSIIGSYEQGHTVASHDQGPEVYIKAHYSTVNVPKEIGNLIGLPEIYTESATSALNFQLSVLQNIAKETKIPQFFVGLSGSVSLPMATLSTKLPTGYVILPLIIEGNVVIQKKFWLSRMAFITEVNAGISTLRLSITDASGTELGNISTGYQYAVGGVVGFEYAFNPDISFGLELGYRYVLAPSTIDYQIGTGDKKSYTKDEAGSYWTSAKVDDLQLGGLRFGARFQYTLPPLF